jgi:hypothetical protein
VILLAIQKNDMPSEKSATYSLTPVTACFTNVLTRLADGANQNLRVQTMNERTTKLESQKLMYLAYAKEARLAGALDVEQEWLVDAAKVQAEIEQAQEGDTARMNRISDIASGRYKVRSY